MLLVAIPISIYFIVNDAFYEMIHATFLFNLMYSNNSSFDIKYFDDIIEIFIFCSLIISSFVATILEIYQKNFLYVAFNFISLILTFISINLSGEGYTHYLIMGAPLFVFSSVIIMKNIPIKISCLLNNYIKISLLICSILLIYITVKCSPGAFEMIEVNENYEENVMELASLIPEDDLDEVFGYNVSAKWFYVSDIVPCYKYFTAQEWMAISDPTILDDINYMMENDPPKWVVLVNDSFEYSNIEFIEQMKNNYELFEYNDSGYLYKLLN